MPVEVIVALIMVAIIGNLVLMARIIAPAFASVLSPTPAPKSPRPIARPTVVPAPSTSPIPPERDWDDEPTTHERVARVVTWLFLIVTGLTVAATGLWPGTQQIIFVLLLFAGLTVILLQDLLPADALGSSRFVVQGTLALSGASILVGLTGGVASPFFFTFPLIVVGAALVVMPAVTIGLTIVATGGFLASVALGSPLATDWTSAGPMVVIDISALFLLSYVAMVISNDQREARDAAIRLSTIDPLTGLFNRGYFFNAIDRELSRTARSGRGFCLLMMDLDELKAINDRLGHFYGDRVLRGIAAVIDSGVRRIDTAARYGGDEFVVVLPETDPTGAFIVAEKIRIGVRSMVLDLPGGAPRPTLSIGVVSYPNDGRSVDELMINADAAMYASKRGGKDRVTGTPGLLALTG